MKKLSSIIGILSVLVFATYYQYAYSHFPEINTDYSAYTNYFLYSTLSIAFFALGSKEEADIKLFLYYAVGEFWGFLAITYIINELADNEVVMHKVIIAILLTFLTSIVWCFRRLF